MPAGLDGCLVGQTAAVNFDAMWAELEPIGRDARTGGYHRFAWTSAERECRQWFLEHADQRGLELEADGNGNLIAWWRPDPGVRAGGVITGSHLDSVPDGGAFDGPLGVVTALAAIDVLRDHGFRPQRPIGVAVFSDEEGGRFGLPCLGSRLMTGAVSPARAAELRDRDGTYLLDAMSAAGFHGTPGPSMDHLHDAYAFVELHVEQGRGLADLDRPVAVGSAIWPHGRWRFEFGGEANHAGTTQMADRRDPMLTFAMTALAANKQARLADVRATFGRVLVEPNGTNAIPSRVTAWLDARADATPALEALVEAVRRQAAERADRDGTTLEVVAESVSRAVELDHALRDRIASALDDPPRLGTGAGHDAGILASAGVPTAMLFVRNPTGVSHSPAEHADRADCHAGVEALATVLTDLSR